MGAFDGKKSSSVDCYRTGGRVAVTGARIFGSTTVAVIRLTGSGAAHSLCQTGAHASLAASNPARSSASPRTATTTGCCSGSCIACPAQGSRASIACRTTRPLKRYTDLFPELAVMHPAKGGHVALHADAHPHREQIDAVARAMAAMPDTSPRLLAALSKWPGLFARLSLTFHLIEIADAELGGRQPPYREVIPEETARRVAKFLVEIVLPHLLRAESLMFTTAQTGHARWIADYILARRLSRITNRDVMPAYPALRAPELAQERRAVMDSLVTAGWLEPEEPNSWTKPVNSWQVNPAVHELFADRAQQQAARRAKGRKKVAADIEVLCRARGGPDWSCLSQMSLARADGEKLEIAQPFFFVGKKGVRCVVAPRKRHL